MAGDLNLAPVPGRPWVAVGPPGARTIVFLHATRYSRAQWFPQLRALSDRFRCVAVDLPGHGLRAAETFTVEGAVAAVREAVLAEAASGRAILVGLSLGGFVAMETADAHPELVEALVLAGCSGDPVGAHSLPFTGLGLLLRWTPHALAHWLSVAVFHLRHGPDRGGAVVEAGFWNEGGAVAVQALVGRRYLERLSRFWVPVLVINGSLDGIFGPQGAHWAASCRRGRHAVIHRAMHMSNLDRPKAFSRLVSEFADEVAAGA